jgi:hypothetical protein
MANAGEGSSTTNIERDSLTPIDDNDQLSLSIASSSTIKEEEHLTKIPVMLGKLNYAHWLTRIRRYALDLDVQEFIEDYRVMLPMELLLTR